MPNSFYAELVKRPATYVEKILSRITARDVETALRFAAIDRQLSPEQFLALLSPRALPFLEELACKAQERAIRHFGKTIQIFAPLYLSNFCVNTCNYCSFNAKNAIKRTLLTLDEIQKEAAALTQKGLKSVLLLTGEAPTKTTVEYIAKAASSLKPDFSSIGIEVHAETQENYKKFVDAGVDAMTLFQETYNEAIYQKLHGSGPKSNFRFRLDAQSRAALAGMRSVTVGALLGLDFWQRDIFYAGLHALWLQKHCPEVELSVSIPRIRPHKGVFSQVTPVDDRSFTQALVALRIFLPAVGIALSTRETAEFRDNLIPLGITKLSAGASTAVGGYAKASGVSDSQFEIADRRTVEEVVAAIKSKGYQPVFKNWFSINQFSACS